MTLLVGQSVTTAQRPIPATGDSGYVFDTTLGKPIYWAATATAWTDATGAAVATAPFVKAPPALGANPVVGQAVTCPTGIWAGSPAPSYAYQWLLDGLAITGATSSTYTPAAADARRALSCSVTATNASGSAVARTDDVRVQPAIAALGPLSASAPTTTAAGATIAAVTGLRANASLSFAPTDGRLAFDAATSSLVAGKTGLAVGATTYTITEAPPNPRDTPRSFSFTLNVSAGTAPTLGPLTLSPTTATVGMAYSGTISGRAAGSTFALSGAGAAGLTVNSATGAVSGTPTTAGAVNIVETLAGATGSPRTSSSVATVGSASVAGYSRADKYFFSSTGPKRSNRAGALTADGSGTQSIYVANYVQLQNGPWVIPAGTDLLAGFANHYAVEGSATVNEQQIPIDTYINTVAVFYNDAGGTQRTIIARKTNGRVGTLSATAADGGVVAACPVTTDIPAGATLTFGIAQEGPAGAQFTAWARPITARGETTRQSASNNFVAVIEAKGGLGVTNANGISFGGSVPAPNFLAAMGADGRPVLLLDSDSLCYGKGTPDIVTSLSRASGIVEVPAKSLANGGYEIPTCNLSIAGSGILITHPSAAEYNAQAQRHGRALVDQVVALNGGTLPWSHYYCGHGNNGERSTLALQVEYKKARFAWLKAWHDTLIIDQTFIPKGTSTDGFRTLANQTPTGSWPDRVGYRDKLAADRIDGTVAFGIDTWTPLVEASSGADGGKFKVRPFSAKNTRAIPAQAASGFADIYLDAAPTPGMALTFLDQSNPRDPTKDVVVIVTAVADVSAGGVTEFQVTNTTGGDSAAKPAQAAGSVIAEGPTTDPLPASVGTHISHLMNQTVASYTGAGSWKGLKDALYAQSSVKWTRS